jgi:two-component system, OmpR family, sensor histidine kinase QseC
MPTSANGSAKLPSFRTRVALTVVAAFVAVYAVLLVFITYNTIKSESGEIDTLLENGAKGIAQALDELPSTVNTKEVFQALRLIDQRVAERNDPAVFFRSTYVSLRLDGSLTDVPLGAPALDYARLKAGSTTHTWQGERYRTVVADSKQWRLVIIDKVSDRSSMVVRSLVADLALYLGLALPIVLLPVWWAVRASLKPLQQLSSAVAQRQPGDLQALVVAKPYRELEPLVSAINHLFERVSAGIQREKGFVHDAAHEMRTPLAVISAQAHVLSHSSGAAHDTAQLQMKAAIARASHLTQQLLRLAQADASAAPAESGKAAVTVDVMDLARDVVAAFEAQAQQRASEVALNGPDSLPWRTASAGHEHLLRSAIENLLDNALRYGGLGCQVEVSVEKNTDHVRITVADNGPGIAPEHRTQVFERFWRGNHDKETGAGLGLAIVQEAVKAFGGTVHVATGLGDRGCAMVVQLPR